MEHKVRQFASENNVWNFYGTYWIITPGIVTKVTNEITKNVGWKASS